jgi:hypothetical protein
MRALRVFTVAVRVLVACSRGGEQDPQRLAGVAGAWLGGVGGGQGLAGGADGIQLVGLAAAAACLLRPVGLDDQVPGGGQSAGQARAV